MALEGEPVALYCQFIAPSRWQKYTSAWAYFWPRGTGIRLSHALPAATHSNRDIDVQPGLQTSRLPQTFR